MVRSIVARWKIFFVQRLLSLLFFLVFLPFPILPLLFFILLLRCMPCRRVTPPCRPKKINKKHFLVQRLLSFLALGSSSKWLLPFYFRFYVNLSDLFTRGRVAAVVGAVAVQ
jgi:hypothetical protein